MSINVILVELEVPSDKLSINANSLYWLNRGRDKEERLSRALKIIAQELCETPDHHKTKERLDELIKARHSLWVSFLADWEGMMRDILLSDNSEIREDVREGWLQVEKLARYMIDKHAKEVDKLTGIYDAPVLLPEPNLSIKMKME